MQPLSPVTSAIIRHSSDNRLIFFNIPLLPAVVNNAMDFLEGGRKAPKPAGRCAGRRAGGAGRREIWNACSLRQTDREGRDVRRSRSGFFVFSCAVLCPAPCLVGHPCPLCPSVVASTAFPYFPPPPRRPPPSPRAPSRRLWRLSESVCGCFVAYGCLASLCGCLLV